jgi:hypothetical protein
VLFVPPPAAAQRPGRPTEDDCAPGRIRRRQLLPDSSCYNGFCDILPVRRASVCHVATRFRPSPMNCVTVAIAMGVSGQTHNSSTRTLSISSDVSLERLRQAFVAIAPSIPTVEVFSPDSSGEGSATTGFSMAPIASISTRTR